MPTYEYECQKCNQTFEVFQSMKDAPFETCPESHCRQEPWGRGKVKRLLGTGAGLIFKGSGFYITDYRSENYKEAAKKDSGAGSGTEGAKGESSKGSGAEGAKKEPAKKPEAPKPETSKPKKEDP